MVKKINNYKIPDKLWDEMNKMIEDSNKVHRESGVLLCKDNSNLKRGKIIYGKVDDIKNLFSDEAACSSTIENLIAAYHTHPKETVETAVFSAIGNKRPKKIDKEKHIVDYGSNLSPGDIITHIILYNKLKKNIIDCVGSKKEGIKCYKLKENYKVSKALNELDDFQFKQYGYISTEPTKIEDINKIVTKKYLNPVEIYE